MLPRTSGVSHCLSTVNSSSVNGILTGTMSFSLKLPPIVFRINLQTINALLDLSTRKFDSLPTPIHILLKEWSSLWAPQKHPSRLRNPGVSYKTQDMSSCSESATVIYILLRQRGNEWANFAWGEMLRTKVLDHSKPKWNHIKCLNRLFSGSGLPWRCWV